MLCRTRQSSRCRLCRWLSGAHYPARYTAKEVLPPEILKVVEAGELEITVQKTLDQPPPQEYIEATLKHSTGVEIEDGQLKNYVTGLPFPLLDPQDPQAGEKAAWNHRYRERGKVQEFRSSVVKALDGAGRAHREMEFYQALAFGMHLANEDQDQDTWTASRGLNTDLRMRRVLGV